VTAIHTSLGVLLSVRALLFTLSAYLRNNQAYQVIKGVVDDYVALVDLFESIEHFLNRLDIYTRIPPTAAMTEIVVKILVELLSTLALATRQINQRKPSESTSRISHY
jgi:hypothetical protein